MNPLDLFNFGPREPIVKDASEEALLKDLFSLPEEMEVACHKMEYVEGTSPRDFLRLYIYGQKFWDYITTRDSRKKPPLPKDFVKELHNVAYALGNYDPSIALVILYGSLDKGRWNPQYSDVDLAVVTESPRYALGSPNLPDLRYAVHRATDRPGMYSVRVVSPFSSVNETLHNDGRGNSLKAIFNGRPIYVRPKVLI